MLQVFIFFNETIIFDLQNPMLENSEHIVFLFFFVLATLLTNIERKVSHVYYFMYMLGYTMLP